MFVSVCFAAWYNQGDATNGPCGGWWSDFWFWYATEWKQASWKGAWSFSYPYTQLYIDAATRDSILRFAFGPVQPLKDHILACEIYAYFGVAWTCEALNRMSQIWGLLEGLRPAIGVDHAQVANLAANKLSKSGSATPTVLCCSKGTTGQAIYGVGDNFPVGSTLNRLSGQSYLLVVVCPS